jgi:hypothetical protein
VPQVFLVKVNTNCKLSIFFFDFVIRVEISEYVLATPALEIVFNDALRSLVDANTPNTTKSRGEWRLQSIEEVLLASIELIFHPEQLLVRLPESCLLLIVDDNH